MIEYRQFSAVNDEIWYDIFIEHVWVGSRRTKKQAEMYVEFIFK